MPSCIPPTLDISSVEVLLLSQLPHLKPGLRADTTSYGFQPLLSREACPVWEERSGFLHLLALVSQMHLSIYMQIRPHYGKLLKDRDVFSQFFAFLTMMSGAIGLLNFLLT